MSNWDEYNNSLDLARALWSQSGLELTPDQFRTLFVRVYENSHNLQTLWQLGGATNDFLRIHSDAITVPADLPITLLNSEDVEARVIGLKLLYRSNVVDEVIVSEIIRAMQRRDQYESYGGFYECSKFLDRCQAHGHTIDRNLIRRLQQVLATFHEDEDPETLRSANYLAERLDAL